MLLARNSWLCWSLGAVLLLVSPAGAQIGTVLVDSGLTRPTYVTHAPGDFDRLFITEIDGDIEIFSLSAETRNAAPFLSIAVSGEGLQGLAFHPDYETNGYFFVYYLSVGQSQIVRYQVSANPDLADAGSAQVVIEILQPLTYHNGGWIGFGPDGYLYLPIGDGGPQHDPDNHGQTNINDLAGAVIRLDVDGDDFPGDPDRNYAIPAGNPFVIGPEDDEIWSYGFRNPFRSSFDRQNGDFYMADVGQDTWEELNFQPALSIGGENYGWRLREGAVATPTGGFGGPLAARTDPLYAYTHGTADAEGDSITGGYVYRGPVVGLWGKYFFADFVNGRIWSIQHDGNAITEFIDWTDDFVPPVGQGTIENVVAFGEDAAANLYIVDFYGGEVFRVEGPTQVPSWLPTTAWMLPLALMGAGLLVESRRAATHGREMGGGGAR